MPAPSKKIILNEASISRNQAELGSILRAYKNLYKSARFKAALEIINEALTEESAEIYESLDGVNQLDKNAKKETKETDHLKALAKEGCGSDLSNPAIKKRFKEKALTWVRSLQNARPHVKALADAHAQCITNELKKLKEKTKNSIPMSEWGADLDLQNCFDFKLTLPEHVIAADTYILEAVNVDLVRSTIDESLKSVIKNGIGGKVSLLIPVSCEETHWRLLKVQIENQAIAAIQLWDSLGNDFTDRNFFSKLQNDVNAITIAAPGNKIVPIEAEVAGLQTNTHSCMDYVVQGILKIKKVDNAITQAKDAATLRLAVCKQIANSLPDADAFSASLCVKDGTIISSEELVQEAEMPAELTQEHTDFLDHLAEKKNIQIHFDNEFAVQLQEIYKTNKNCDEKKSQNIAFIKAYSLFKPKIAALLAEASETETEDKKASSGNKSLTS